MSAPSKSGYITGNIWERVLIMIFGFALLMIGANHFNEPYGGIVNYMRNFGARLSGNDRNDSPYGFSSKRNYSDDFSSVSDVLPGRARLRSDWSSPADDDIDSGGSASFRYEEDGLRAREKRARIIPMPQEVQRAVKSGNINRLPKDDDVGESNRRELNRLINNY